MKKIMLATILLLALLLVSSSLSSAENYYNSDSMELKLQVSGDIHIKANGSDPQLKNLGANLYLFPQDDFRQTVTRLETSGLNQGSKLRFYWDDGKLGTKHYSYTALMETKNKRLQVRTNVHFPLSSEDTKAFQQYLLPSLTIDSDNPKIIAKATELAEGEDDLFKVSFKMADWVEENVKYDLNSLTSSASQKASWVLDNREGVCDEMTSLFVAMMRSLGVPARFVSGISYTTSELFDENWQPHGWAEVYFPYIGWVSFDIAFGEYGYIDITHVKLRDSVDTAEAGTDFQWLSNDIMIEAPQLSTEVEIIKTGEQIPEELQLEMELMNREVGFGSYNLVKGILKNQQEYYVAKTLQLAIPPEMEIVGKNKRKILLEPKEVKETYWIIRVPELDHNYVYTFPIVVYTETNSSVKDEIKVQEGALSYSLNDMERLTMEDEDKTYSRKISIKCDYPQIIKLKEQGEFNCVIKNIGNTNLQGVNFCLNDVCEIIDLPINQEKSSNLTINAEKAGWQKVFVSAENDMIEKKTVLEYVVEDEPKISLMLEAPPKINYGEEASLKINLLKESFSLPQNITVVANVPGAQENWAISELKDKEELVLLMNSERMSSDNKFKVMVRWQDDKRQDYSLEDSIVMVVAGQNFWQRLKMLFNGIFY